jgi:putative NADH-flavin reductase
MKPIQRITRLATAALLLVSVTLLSQETEKTSRLDILVYGASGKVGRQIVDEALMRGHRVTAVSRDPSRITPTHEQLSVRRGDILDPDSVSALVSGQDVVVVSVRGVIDDSGDPESAVAYIGSRNVIDALRREGDSAGRLIHVGGSGSLELDSGTLLADRLPGIFLPRELETEIAGQVLTLNYLRTVRDVKWTYATPPRNFTGGERTGEFRIGGDRLMEDARGRSMISRSDFAVAVIDEAESGQFTGLRFSVAY